MKRKYGLFLWLIIKYAFIKIRIFFLKEGINHVKHRWFISKNRNYYNPSLEARSGPERWTIKPQR